MKKLKCFLIFLFLSSCGYSPIYQSNQEPNYRLDIVEYTGDKEINRSIMRGIGRLTQNESNNVLSTKLNTSKKESAVSKDKKGNASSYKISIVVDLYLNNKSINKNFEKRFMKETIYNSMENKFELSQYKKNLEKNMISQILQDINIFLSILENDL